MWKNLEKFMQSCFTALFLLAGAVWIYHLL